MPGIGSYDRRAVLGRDKKPPPERRSPARKRLSSCPSVVPEKTLILIRRGTPRAFTMRAIDDDRAAVADKDRS